MIKLSYGICYILFTTGILNTPAHYLDSERFNTCEQVASEAIARNVSPVVAVSMAWEESRFQKEAVSRTGCCHGPLQINPSYFCKEGKLENCDLIGDGVNAVKIFHRRFSRSISSEPFRIFSIEHGREWADPLCHYNAGNRCTPRSRAYARRIIRRADLLSGALAYNSDIISDIFNEQLCI